MPEPVRVRDNVTGHEYSTYGVNEKGEVDEGLTVLDEDAVNERGELLPPKYPTVEEPATPAPKPTVKPQTTSRQSTTEEN